VSSTVDDPTPPDAPAAQRAVAISITCVARRQKAFSSTSAGCSAGSPARAIASTTRRSTVSGAGSIGRSPS